MAMTKKQQANIVFQKSIQEARGYIELAKMQAEMGADNQKMRECAIKALQQFSDNDDLVEAIYEAEMK